MIHCSIHRDRGAHTAHATLSVTSNRTVTSNMSGGACGHSRGHESAIGSSAGLNERGGRRKGEGSEREGSRQKRGEVGGGRGGAERQFFASE